MRFNELISGVRSDVAVKVYGDDFAVMERTANEIADVLRKTKGAADVRVEQVSGLPMVTAEVDRAAAALYGLHAADAADAVQIALAGREAGRVFEGDRRFDVVVRLPDSARNDLATVAQTPLAVNDGASFVPLGSVVRFREGEGPNQISRGERQAAHRGPGQRARSRSWRLRHRRPSGGRGAGEGSAGRVARLGRPV